MALAAPCSTIQLTDILPQLIEAAAALPLSLTECTESPLPRLLQTHHHTSSCRSEGAAQLRAAMPSSEQENLSGGGGGGGEPAPLCKPLPAAPVAPFRFRAPRALIDWNALRALDVGAVVRDTDIDALEGVLEAVASGDLEAEDPRALPFADLAKLFRAAQLTVGYLLHVQDRLATDACAAKVGG